MAMAVAIEAAAELAVEVRWVEMDKKVDAAVRLAQAEMVVGLVALAGTVAALVAAVVVLAATVVVQQTVAHEVKVATLGTDDES